MYQGPRWGYEEKTSGLKSRDTIPLNTCPQYLSPKFTKLWAKYPTRFPIARNYETFPSLLLVHTEKSVALYLSSLQTWDLNTGD
jgi:hypothetical protein